MTPGFKYWDIKMNTSFQQQGNNRSVQIIAGSSGTTRVLTTVAELIEVSRSLLAGLKLAILGVYISEGPSTLFMK